MRMFKLLQDPKGILRGILYRFYQSLGFRFQVLRLWGFLGSS